MNDQSIMELAEMYKKRSALHESSLEIFDRAVRWFTDLAGDIEARKVGYAEIDDYKTWLIKPRARDERFPGATYTPSPGSANTYLRIIKPFFGWLHRRGFVERDPFDGIRLYKQPKKLYSIYDRDEIRRMFRVANPIWTRILALGLCGMREAEILNLCLSDVDFESNEITVTAKDDTPVTWRWTIKDSDQRIIGIDDTIASLLVQAAEDLTDGMPYLNLKPKYWRRNLRKRDAGDLGHRQRNNPWGNFTRDFKGLLARANVQCSKSRPRRFHDLRDTFATERFRAGYDITQVQSLLGHASINTTRRYIVNIKERDLAAKSARIFEEYYSTYIS